MRGPLAVLMVLTFLGATPAWADTSSTGLYTFEDAGTLSIDLQTTRNGTDAADTRRQIDQSGNGDGTVSQDEVDRSEQSFLNLTRQFKSAGSEEFTLDSKPFNNLTFTEVEIRDAVGPRSSTDPLIVRLVARLVFPVVEADQHTLSVRPNESAPGNDVNSATLVLPTGFKVKSTAGLPPGAAVSSDKSRIQFSGPFAPESGEMKIVYATGASLASGMGGAWLWFVVGAVILLAVVAAIAFAGRRKK
jgi:hypothetical protein